MRQKMRTQASHRKMRGNTLVGLFVGLVIGVLGAAGVVWYIYRTPLPFAQKHPPAAPPATAPAGISAPTAAAANGAAAPLPLPGKPGDPVPQNGDKPRFDFYKILPGNSEATPQGKTAEGKAKTEKDASLAEALFLQSGAFQNAGDADNQKARLAMLGVEATVHQVMLQDKTWYRVRLGPFRKMDELSAVRAELAKQGIEAHLVKKD